MNIWLAASNGCCNMTYQPAGKHTCCYALLIPE